MKKEISFVFLLLVLTTNGDLHKGFNKDHIRDELTGVLPEDQFGLEDEESMNLHYFKIHDKDKNNKLDGLELGAAMTHYHDEDEHGRSRDRHVDVSDEELFDLISSTLKEDDLDDDGYVDFFEFVKSQHKGVDPENPTY
ncbi:PREDICTED: multiple coagulation factor deficiency protein 2-like [Amphimedon queenslandica]|uniref:EF-hand domain-containing protein n=1 Tax=Amphimedon queenslandica TaxID=400682 RepID=A0A1X7VCA2_AMPQE|nr:PREDICTED: multiple coagulation factor deficiency protein 2-like [Amphimedon queenslandica]|eukprot:XP_011402457.2 PREDICTED: multiple coagulation factor deficiency protein 2-like [Amphimedon queenslandica]